MVLLKNEDNILPIKEAESIAVIGAFAKKPRYQGGGSSHINPTNVDDIYEEFEKAAGNKTKLTYAEGYNLQSDDIDENLINQAKKAAKDSKVAVIFVGFPDRYESEGFDKEHIRIPENHVKLIEAVTEVQSNVIVVLSNGSAIEMPWLSKVKAVLEGYLGGQALGGAIADLIFGKANPCGKLAETFPKKVSHNPSYLNFPGDGDKIEYREGVFVGYRYYDTKDIQPLFPFGYGLSYTEFEYSDIKIDKKEISDNETVTVSVKVKNIGSVEGKEIVQLYVKDVESTVQRPEKELKGFEKIFLKPGEEKTVTFTLDKRAFAYYNVQLKDWHVETGEFEILVGKSSGEILLKEKVKVNSTVTIKKKITKNSTLRDLMEDPVGAQIVQAMMAAFPAQDTSGVESLGMDPQEVMKNIVLRTMVAMSNGAFSEEMLEGILLQINGSN